MRLLHHHLDEDRRSHHDTTAPTSPVLSTSITATTSTADTEPQGQPPPPPLNMSQESSRSRIEPVTAGGAGGTNCCSVNNSTQDDKKKKRKKNVPEPLRSPLQQAKGDASSNTSRRAASRATGSHNSMSINMLVSLLLFVVLTGAGITVYVVMLQAGEAAMRNEAMQAAVEVGDFFAKELDLAILPLFSMAQFATELDQFVGLPRAIEPLPFMQNESLNVVMRNVSGICNDPAVLEKFNHIAASIKNSSHTDGVLHNIQLSPQGILCLAYPLNNTEDFVHTARPDSFLDVSGAIGLDLMNEPEHMYIAKSTMIQDEVGIAGPRPLLQCANCGLYFIVRLPIYSATHEINVDGKLYPRWGFATALINWDALVARSRVHERFKARGFTFQLTRTDHTYNSTTQTDGSNVVILTESHGFAARPRGCGQVVTALQTTNNEWTMTVVYKHQDKLWVPMLAILAILVVSCFVSSLIYTVLMQRQAHAAMQGTAMAQHAKVEIERHMTAYFAHELRNPLSAIDCALSVLKEKEASRSNQDDNDDPETGDIVTGMQLCTSFMSSIMNNLLDSRKLEEGKMVLKKNPLSLEGLVKDVRQMMAPAVQPGVELLVLTSCHNDGGRGDWVFGDVHRLQQVLTNVTSNSIKFTRSGSITLVVAGWEGDLVRLECRDTGPGIPKDEQGQMFQKFTTRGGAPGTGLGLSIAKQIVDLMGGSIRFDSDPTVRPGTTCVILLPLKPCEEASSSLSFQGDDEESTAGAAAADESVRNGATNPPLTNPVKQTHEQDAMIQEPLSILLTDDIKMNRIMLKHRLEKCIAPNCSIQEAATGEEALQLCASNFYDVVIMDQHMEEAGGILVGTDVIIAMRRSKLRSLIVGCSGNDLDDLFWSAGADVVWKKPIPSNAEIIRHFRQHLNLRQEDV